jgi:outer membrane protein assembly factor BamB
MPEPAGHQPTVFICYAKEDQTFAGALFAALKSNGVLPWMDRPPEAFQLEGVLPGQNFPLLIEQKLGEADCLLLVLSPASIAQQGFVQSEFRLALHAAGRRPDRIPIVPVLQQACDLPAFAVGSVALDALDWIDYSAGGLLTVIATIRSHAASGKAPTPAARAAMTEAISNPRIRWRACVGRMHWRNTLQLEGDAIYLSSCGTRWNQDDRGDGVVCLDADTGAVRWAFNSAGDANELLLHGEQIVVGTDAGQLAVLDKATGTLRRDHRAWDAIFARPFALSAGGEERVFAISHKGAVLMLEPDTRTIAPVATLPFPMRANAAVRADGQSAILFGETGEIVRAWSGAATPFQWEVLATKTLFQPDVHQARRKAGLVAAPVLDGQSVIGGVIRDRYYGTPPLFRFDLERKAFLWGEREQEQRAGDIAFGNLRSRPLVMGGAVIFAPAYAAAIFAADKNSGELLWKIPVGQELFQQWSSPVAVDDRRILLARADGILYQIDIAAHEIQWALSLLVTPSEMQAANRAGKLGPGPSEAAHNGITATPVWDGGRILLGTTEGSLFCIEQKA